MTPPRASVEAILLRAEALVEALEWNDFPCCDSPDEHPQPCRHIRTEASRLGKDIHAALRPASPPLTVIEDDGTPEGA